MAQRAQTTAVANWEAELEKQAQIAAGMAASTGAGDAQFFSIAQGQLSLGGMEIPGSQMGCVILDWIHENVYYEGVFDRDNRTPATCFAFARDAADLAPHPSVFEASQAQHDTCRGCPQNAWGSASRGIGKACRNIRRLAIIPGGTINLNTPAPHRFEPFTDSEQFERSAVTILKVPVTSSRGFDTFVKQVANALRRPPHGIFTRVVVKPDSKNAVSVTFEPLAPLPNDIIGIAMRRHAEIAESIEQPYALSYDEAPAQTNRGAQSARKAKY